MVALATALLLLVGCSTTEIASGTDRPAGNESVSDTAVVSETAMPDSAGTSEPEDDGAAVPALTMASTEPPETELPETTPVTVVPLSGWAAVDQYLETTIIRGGSSAASVAVLRNGALQHQAAFGNRVAGEPTEPTDRFRIASISKTILAITALELVEDGVLSLDDPVGARLAAGLDVGGPSGVSASITLRHLLTHRSGFPQFENLFFRNEVGSCADAARAGFSRSLQSVPGTSFQYSNLNYCVIGLLIEQVTGTPYDQVVAEQVLDPLGITEMRTAGTFELEPGDVEHASDAGRNYMETLGGAGAWLAAPADLVTILDSLDPSTAGPKILEPATLQLMATITEAPPTLADEAVPELDLDAAAIAPTTTIEPLPPTRGYGMGLMIFDQPLGTDNAAATFGHTGTLESTHAMFVRRSDGLTWAITVSGDYPGSTRDLATIMDNALLLGGLIDGSYTAPPPPLFPG